VEYWKIFFADGGNKFCDSDFPLRCPGVEGGLGLPPPGGDGLLGVNGTGIVRELTGEDTLAVALWISMIGISSIIGISSKIGGLS
jgi:hypothetical protein